MIFKSEILAAIGDLDKDLFAVERRLAELEARVSKMETKKETKRKPGRPRKNPEDDLEKAIKAVAQPRDKSGKFAKKK